MTSIDLRELLGEVLTVLATNQRLATPARLAVVESVVIPNLRNILAATLNTEQYGPYLDAVESVVATEQKMATKFNAVITGMVNHFLDHQIELDLLARVL